MSKAQFQVIHDNLNHKLIVKKVPAEDLVDDQESGFYVVRAGNREDVGQLSTNFIRTLVNHIRVKKVKRFSTLDEALSMGYEAIRTMANSEQNTASLDDVETGEAGEGGKKSKRAKKEKVAKEPKGPRITNIAPKPLGEQKAAREGSKIAAMLDLLFQEGGVTAAELKAQLQRNGRPISGRVHRVHGYGIRGEAGEKGMIRYFGVLPDGMDAPLPHVAKPEPKPKAEKAPKAEGGEEGKSKRGRRRKATSEEAIAAASDAEEVEA